MGCEFPGFNDLRVLPAKICYNFIKNCCPISSRAKRGIQSGVGVYFERQSIIYVTDSRFSEGRFEGRKDVMQSVLLGVFVSFLPSILMVAWLVWQAHGCGASGLDLDR